jgi:hypothetical protein
MNPNEPPHDRSDRAAPRMATPARADRITVETLLQWAREGRIRMPSFQRHLRWDARDRRNLLDSMERGYPVGTLLLWKRPASAKEVGKPLRGASALPTEGDVYLVVDGQQRTVTLWDALGRPPEPGENVMVFELSPKEEFRLRPQSRVEQGSLQAGKNEPYPPLPLYLALDATALSEWVPPDLPRDVKRRYFEVGRRLREYPLPIYVVEGEDLEVLRHVFDRTNSTGKSLTREDVFDALVGSRIVVGDYKGLELVNDQISDLGFGELDRSTILKAFEAIRGDTIGKSDPRSIATKSAEADLLRTAKAFRMTILFLRERAGVPHIAVAPYELPIIVLARFFSLFEKPAERSLVLLRRWLWRGAIAERLSGASGSIQQHVDDVKAGDEHGTVQALLRRTGVPVPPAPSRDTEEPFSIAHARGKMIVCALVAHHPRDLVSGEKLDASKLFERDLGGILRAIVPPRSMSLGRSFANRLLHPPRGVSPARLVMDSLDEGALASHGLERDAQRALRTGDAATFLSRRSAVLGRGKSEFFDRQAEWERDDAPPVVTLAMRRTGS